MQRDLIEELYRELEATNEDYIRKRLLTGGYAGWKAKHVKQFLAARDSARYELRATQTARWTMIGAIGTFCAAAVAVVAILWK